MRTGPIIFAVLIAMMIFLSACSTTYICYTGEEVKKKSDCKVYPTLLVDKRDAERAIDNFGNSYANALKARFTAVRTYLTGSNYMSQVTFVDNTEGNIHEMTLFVNGTTGVVSCHEGCDYLVQ